MHCLRRLSPSSTIFLSYDKKPWKSCKRQNLETYEAHRLCVFGGSPDYFSHQAFFNMHGNLAEVFFHIDLIEMRPPGQGTDSTYTWA